MLDFEHARKKSFDEICQVNSAFILNLSEKKELGFSKFVEAWSIKAEIFMPDNSIKVVDLYVCFPDDFPLVLPRIYLSEHDKEWIGYIPHVDVARYICTFDEEGITLDSSLPGKIVKSTLAKATGIIEDGLAKKNSADFEDEFIAYWNEQYTKKDEILAGITMLDPNSMPSSNSVKFLNLKTPYVGYSVILHDESTDFLRFKSVLVEKGHAFDELEGFYLGQLASFQPPFDITNEGLHSLVQQHFPALMPLFKRFINQPSYPKVLLFSIVVKQKTLIFGWRIFRLETARKGFRPTALSAMDVLNSFQKNDAVQRLKFDAFTKTRLQLRTDGHLEKDQPLKIAIAGLGSVGSNLLHYILPLNINKLVLIDPDILTIENINRHLLGMDFVGTYKVDSIKKSLESNNPLLEIKGIKKSIVRLMINDMDMLNQCDYIFVAIGKTNIEEYLINALKENALQKPVFILWVEPYLCGAHCLLVQPGNCINLDDLYTDGLFNYNIISETEYKDTARQLNFREAGCQSSYLPYGQKKLTLFLASLIPEIYNIIERKERRNLRIMWKGNEQQQKELNLKLSKLGEEMAFGALTINEL